MARTFGGRYAPMALAVVAFVLTFAAVLFYALAGGPHGADRVAGPRAERAVAIHETPSPPPEPLAAATEAIDLLRLEVAAAREEAALARAEAALARESAAALAGELAEAARRSEETAARQGMLEATLAGAIMQPPRVTVRVAEPPEPKVVVHTAEPEVTVEPPGTGAGEPRIDAGRGEPRTREEPAAQPPQGGPEPPAALTRRD
ncbi:MAG TPA: hypothetical protein VFG47_19300 [Geminicoccaceae bacterium]|nr:hypothetical protein [Geminicoccaceae bacterium]